MRSSLLVRVAAVIAAAAAIGLAVDIAIAGTGRAAALASVIAGFCELGALVLGATAWAAGRRASAAAQSEEAQPAVRTSSSPKSPIPDKRGQDGKYVVDARGAAGLQIGDGNVQRVAFRRSTPDS